MVVFGEVEFRLPGLGFRANGDGRKWDLPDRRGALGKAHYHGRVVPLVVGFEDEQGGDPQREGDDDEPPYSGTSAVFIFKLKNEKSLREMCNG